nr:MAG: replication associated protein [Cressdnaviricota sp.]
MAKVEKKNKGFRLSSKNFFLTYPQCQIGKSEAFELLALKETPIYCLIAREYHEDGEPHLHVLISYAKKKDVRNEKFFDINGYHGNYQAARDTDDVRAYVQKADMSCFEHGMYLSNNQTAVQKRAIENKLILTQSMPELIDSGVIHMANYVQIRHAKELYKIDSKVIPTYMPKTCYWITGDTGIGKSRWVRDTYGDKCYYKPMNKWWDGYKGETVVLIDDFDLKGECLGHYLKIWADCYSFNAEIKNGTIQPVIDTFIITSQYEPQHVFCQGKDPEKWDSQLVDAIRRRFQLKTIDNGQIVDKY